MPRDLQRLRKIIKNEGLVEEKKIEQIKAVLDEDPGLINICGVGFGTPLDEAVCEEDNIGVVKLLLERGAFANIKNSIYIPLFISVDEEDGHVTKLLLERGADPNVENTNSYTPLHSARGNSMTILLKHGANPNSTNIFGDIPLHLSALNGYINEVKELIQAGADINRKNKNGKTPLDLAQAKGHQKVVDLLKEPQKAPQQKRTISDVIEVDGTSKKACMEETEKPAILKRKNSEKAAENAIPSKQAGLEELQVTESFGQLSL